MGRLVAAQAVIVDPDSGARLGAGRTGELWLRGPQLMSGYLGDEAATAATIDPEGWLHTGDLGRFDAAGNLFLVDRLKELIKVRGYQVAPAQLEAELRASGRGRRRCRTTAGRGVRREPVAYVTLCAPARAGRDRRVAGRARGALQAAGRGRRRGRDAARPTGKLLRRVLVERERERAAGRSTASVASARAVASAHPPLNGLTSGL